MEARVKVGIWENKVFLFVLLRGWVMGDVLLEALKKNRLQKYRL